MLRLFTSLVLASALTAGAADSHPPAKPSGYCEVGAFTPDLAAFRKICDGKLANSMFYMNWNDPPSEFSGASKHFQLAATQGCTPWIKWSPVLAGYSQGEPHYRSLYDEILAGKFDDYLRACASELAKVKIPFRFDFAHEMNGRWKPYSGPVNARTPEEGAQKFVKIWRKVHDIFEKAGVRNCLWVWAPAALREPMDKTKAGDLSHYYPGDAYVDEIGFSVYNKGARLGQNLTDLFQYSYDAAAQIAPCKPVVISEMGCASDDPHKAEWITATFATLKEKYPRVRAFNWFNRDSRKKEADKADFRIEADPATSAAMTHTMADPWYTGTSHLAEAIKASRLP